MNATTQTDPAATMPREAGSGTDAPGCSVAVNVPPEVVVPLSSFEAYESAASNQKIWKEPGSEKFSKAKPFPSSSTGLVLVEEYRRLSLLSSDSPQQVPGSNSWREFEKSKEPLIDVIVNGEFAPVVVKVPDPR
jgi:hypothetical protein